MAAVIAIINYQNKILIGKKKSDSKKFLAGEWHIPGETVKDNETDEQALIRGAKEETGLDIIVGRYVSSHLTPTSKKDARWYECFAKTDNAVPGSDLEELKWVPKEYVLFACSVKATSLWTKEVMDYFLA
jgi:ADP-ribose pyrophosphatase YjhB (NUDIX family)